MPVKRLNPTAASVTSTSVAPVNPETADKAFATVYPMTPPCLSGSATARLWKRNASTAALATISRRNPPTASASASAPPVSGQSEEVEQDVCEPGAEASARVLRHCRGRAVRPAGIALTEGGQDQEQVAGQGDQNQPFGLAQQARELCRKGCALGLVCRRHRAGPESGSLPQTETKTPAAAGAWKGRSGLLYRRTTHSRFLPALTALPAITDWMKLAGGVN